MKVFTKILIVMSNGLKDRFVEYVEICLSYFPGMIIVYLTIGKVESSV